MIPLVVPTFTLLVVFASSTSGDLQSLRFADPRPIRIWDERERLVAASPVMTKSWSSSREKRLAGVRPRETAEKLHASPQPSRYVLRKGAAPLSGAEEHTARTINAYAQCACLLSLQMGSIN
jgi:hypothetical protein